MIRLAATAFRWPLLGLWLLLNAGCTSPQQAELSLFDGQTLKGWRSFDASKWWVSDGAILLQSGEDGYLVSQSSYGSYDLSIEFWADRQVNSGVFVHCGNPQDISPVSCYEINIWDEHPRQEYRTGAIVTHVRPRVRLDTVGQWNRYDISVGQDAIVVLLNGVEVSRLEKPEKSQGYLAFQRQNGGEVRFRNITLKPL